MSKNSTDVSVIIVNYNTTGVLCNAIDSVIDKTTGLEFEIIVIDNDSVEDPGTQLKNKYGDRLRLERLPENIGYGRACNKGAELAAGRNLLFLNPDTILLNNVLKILSDFIDNNTGTGAAGGNIYDADRNASYSYRRFLPSLKWEINDLLFTLPEKIMYGKNRFFNTGNNPVPVAYTTGAAFMMASVVFREAGGFKPLFFLYFEEADLNLRLKKLNYRIINVPDAELIHLEGASFENESHRLFQYLKGKYIYYNINFSKTYLFFVDLCIITTFIMRRLIFYILADKARYYEWKNKAAVYKKAKSSVRGILMNNNLSDDRAG